MADNVNVTPGVGATVHADEYTHTVLGSGKTQLVKIVDGTLDSETPLKVVAEDAALAGGEGGILAMAKRNDTPDNLSGTDGDAEYLQVSGGKLWVKPLGNMKTVTATVTRAANVTTYASGDAVGTSAAGGVVVSGIARISGGSGIITDMMAMWDDVTVIKMQGEVWLFDSTITVTADNAAFTCTDAESKTLVGIIPFALSAGPSQDLAHVQNLSIGFTTVGSADLYMAVVIRSASVPIANSSILTFRFKALQVD